MDSGIARARACARAGDDLFDEVGDSVNAPFHVDCTIW